MTCAHIVNVALKKLPGVESADVSLNKALVKVRFTAGNTISVPQLWQLLGSKGYTPRTTVVSVRGDVTESQGRFQLKVAGTPDVISLAPYPGNLSAWSAI